MNIVTEQVEYGAEGRTYTNFLLPGGAILRYYPIFLCEQEREFYYETFELIPWQQGGVRGGNENRLTRFFSNIRGPDGQLRKYYYSGKENEPIEMSDEMDELRAKITAETGYQFNSCLANYYADGTRTIGMHSDSETSLVPGSAIASVSLGAVRYFDVVAKETAPNPHLERLRIPMASGSMIIMAGEMQRYYKHGVPRQATVRAPRINLTFRLSQ